jgi:hypothetical protein
VAPDWDRRPEGEERHYEQSAALAARAGLVLMLSVQVVLLGVD